MNIEAVLTPDWIAELKGWLDRATPSPWTVYHRDMRGNPETDEMSSGLGLEIKGPPEPALRGQFAKAADAQVMARSREAMPALIAERATLLAALDKTVTALIHHHSVRHDDCDSCTARDVGEAILRRSGGER